MSHYCIVKLGLGVGLMAAMLIHAAGESSSGNLPANTRAVALGAHEEDLARLAVRLEAAEVEYQRIEEDGELLAIGISPVAEEKLKVVKKATSSFPLIR